jgi:hypothetical protein
MDEIEFIEEKILHSVNTRYSTVLLTKKIYKYTSKNDVVVEALIKMKYHNESGCIIKGKISIAPEDEQTSIAMAIDRYNTIKNQFNDILKTKMGITIFNL